MTDMDRRIEAAAIGLFDAAPKRTQELDTTWSQAPNDWKAAFRDTATKSVRAAFPELFTDPPTAWIAPWEATEKLMMTPWHNLSDYDLPKARGDIFGLAFAAMRDAHLAEPLATSHEQE